MNSRIEGTNALLYRRPMTELSEQKALASTWFRSLQEQLISAFERLEEQAGPDHSDLPAGKFDLESWERGPGQGGGRMGMLEGRVFEKAGIHFSEVYGEFSEEFRTQIPGAEENPNFWACGVSLIAHTRNPHAPSAHMNTRMVVTTKQWFGGGGDLNPMMDRYRSAEHEDTRDFHAAMKEACEASPSGDYPKFKKWADDYFWLPHREEHRGVGGIFYDRLNTGDWEADFGFTQAVGQQFLKSYPALVERRMDEAWTDDEREEQMFRRGRYAEFNLLYDRGTTFGLKTGGNVRSILSSLPPVATWRSN